MAAAGEEGVAEASARRRCRSKRRVRSRGRGKASVGEAAGVRVHNLWHCLERQAAVQRPQATAADDR